MAASVVVLLLQLAFVTAVATAHKEHQFHYRSFLGRTKDGQWDNTIRLPELPFNERLSKIATLQVNPAVIAHSGDQITVSWSDIANPKSNDWVGLYMSNTSANTDYLDFEYVSGSSTWPAGRGSLQFSVINIRTPFQFRYFQYSGSNAYNLIQTSNTVTFANINEPLQGHIALTNVDGQMRIMFTTDSFETPVVQFGVSPNDYSKEQIGVSSTYTAQMMCGSPANIESPSFFIDPGVMHDVLLENLEPATQYFYRFGHHSTGFSTERSFRTPPIAGTPTSRFIAYGDMGVSSPGGVGVAERVLAEVDNTDYILHFGDVSYAVSRGFLWETWGALIDPIATKTPYMVGIGNHEYCYLTQSNGKDPSGATGNGWHPSWGNYGSDSGEECGVPTYYRYHMPDNGNSVFWYSFRYGNVHVQQMSTEHDFLPGSVQYNWMQQDLRSVNRTLTPFVIVTGHRPMYASENYPSDYRVAQNIQAAIEDLLVENQVDVFLSGHYHSVEVTCFVYKNKCYADNGQNKGMYHVMVGSAGAYLDNVGYYDVEWRAFAEQTFGYERITTSRTEMILEFIRTDDNVVRNTVTIKAKF